MNSPTAKVKVTLYLFILAGGKYTASCLLPVCHCLPPWQGQSCQPTWQVFCTSWVDSQECTGITRIRHEKTCKNVSTAFGNFSELCKLLTIINNNKKFCFCNNFEMSICTEINLIWKVMGSKNNSWTLNPKYPVYFQLCISAKNSPE